MGTWFAYTLLLLHSKRTEQARAILTVLRDSARAAGYVYREVALEAALSECAWHAGAIARARELQLLD